MGAAWSQVQLGPITSVRDGDTVMMSSVIHLTARTSGARIQQPFAEVLRFDEGRLIEGTPFYHDTAQLMKALGN